MKTKIVVFDFDGTLTKPHKLSNSWARVWNKINCLDKDEFYYKQYVSGQINYKQWLELCFECFKEQNVLEKDFIDIAKEIELVDYIEDYLKFLSQNGIKIFILSGGIGNIIDYKIDNLKKYITSIEADMFLIGQQGNLVGVKECETSVETKSQFILSLMSKYGLDKQEIVFVGNGLNDEEVYKSGVKTICVNPDEDAHPENPIFWTHAIKNCNDIRQTLEFID